MARGRRKEHKLLFCFRNVKRKSLTALNINGSLSNDPNLMNKFVFKLYGKLYNSNLNAKDYADFLEKIQPNIPLIDENF